MQKNDDSLTQDKEIIDSLTIEQVEAQSPSLDQMIASEEHYREKHSPGKYRASEAETRHWDTLWSKTTVIDEAYGMLARELRIKHHEALDLSIEEAKKLVWHITKSLCPNYILTDSNTNLLYQLTLYFTRDTTCALNLDKGIYLYGNIGRGKTLLMTIFQLFTLGIKYRQFRNVSCLSISQDVTLNGLAVLEKYAEGSFCFDDLGWELPQVFYGTHIDIMELILARSERTGHIIHVTTNLKPEEIIDRYGERIDSRSKSLFNFIELEGPIDFRV